MIPRLFIFLLATIFVMTPVAAVAGHHYHGCGKSMSSWDMSEMDANKDNSLTFEEYSENHRQKLRAGFNMIDTDKDGVISEAEWKTFLEVHGVKMDS